MSAVAEGLYIGVNLGALSVKAVALRGVARTARVLPHHGRPLEVLNSLMAEPEFSGPAFYGVSGTLGHITEAAAMQRALQELRDDFNAIVSLGGESFLVYIVTDGKITNVLSHNKCAAGSGEFFVQQIGRMGLQMNEAILLSFQGKAVPLASRCSVHCKSDITHKLNRKEASVEDILHTLHESMAAKVVALLEKAQCPLHRVLLTGGVTQNRAMAAALRTKLPGTEFMILPESPWFEAWGCALLVQDEPVHKELRITRQPVPSTLPPLSRYSDRVLKLAEPPLQTVSEDPLVLGLDAGSTTTKAVLLHPLTRTVLASYYTRTHGDPVAAARECLMALAGCIGNHTIAITGTTGSARELTGAYLGTQHVYNEISAQAAGAACFDPEVDTIFEIGGQDSKYIYLRNGVPVDYAMNNACSAGTGSFLEESAQSDLGISVPDIAGIALAAPAPIKFKATCAAFINSDIRIAQQQGQSRENIVAGLVYSIADNYLNRVKGPRYVGKKVFLQGGVALNVAVAHAFAHSVGRQVVIPPHPELIGAIGAGLLALERSRDEKTATTDLLTLSAPEMKTIGRFTCKACGLYCGIDRFEVAGRRFPFGGRCSLYENVWKRKSRVPAAEDLVETRSTLLFAPPPKFHGDTIGIPRALTTHSLFPLFATFFSELGMEVVLSDVDLQGELRSNAAFCFPVQIAHGAVLDLIHRGVTRIFLPHVSHMPHSNPCRDCFICPVTQASPYVAAKAFPEVRFLSPLLDFAGGYAASRALVNMAVRELGISQDRAEQAYSAAVHAQTNMETALHQWGEHALLHAVSDGKPAILLAGHSYNAFAPEASQSVNKKLSSMGIAVIPADCLAPVVEGPTAWHFANQIMNAVALARRHSNLFLLCVSNFSCTIDAFTHAMLASELGSKPYLILEIDAHTADAGIQTRLEAFLDIIHNYRTAQSAPKQPFKPCRVAPDGTVIRGDSGSVPLRDPRVRIYFPTFSRYHSECLALAARWLGLNPGVTPQLDRSQLERGLQYTSGRECLPLPICIGQMLQIHEDRRPGEIIGFYMGRGGAPCVSDCYMGYLEQFVADHRLQDLFLMSAGADNNYLGLGVEALVKCLPPAILVADILEEVESVLRVAGGPGSLQRLHHAWMELVAAARTLDQFDALLPAFVARLAALPRTRDPLDCPRVVITGDFFTRFSPFFMKGVHELYTKYGIILKPVDLSDFILYGSYQGVAETALEWGLKPGGLALAKACTRIFQPDGKYYLQQWLNYQLRRRIEQHYRDLFQPTGWLIAGSNDVSALLERASLHVSPAIYGETIPTVGKGLEADHEGYDGIIVIGPFNCLPYRISEAILKPLCISTGMPLLTYESDGYSVSPSVIRQVEVHIQQVLERTSESRRHNLSDNLLLSAFAASQW